MMRFSILIFALTLLVQTASAQLMVQAASNRELYVQGEPVMMTVAIRNLTGREVTLDGRENSTENWLGFEVETRDGGFVTGFQNEFKIEPVTLAAGETLRRKINLSKLYVLNGVGDFRVKATVYFGSMNKYFYTKSSFFTLTPGTVIWNRTVGAPDGSGHKGYRHYELVTLSDMENTRLYARITNANTSNVEQCMMLDRLVMTVNPQATIDNQNLLHVIFMSRPQVMKYLHLGFNGEVLREEHFRTNATYPKMLQLADGTIRVSGGTLMQSQDTLNAMREAAGPPPRVSDRPGS